MLVTALDILKKVSDFSHIGEKEILGRSRRQGIANARVLYWTCLRMNGYNIEAVSMLAGRDHSTVAKLTRDHYERTKTPAINILKSLGGEVFEMMIKPQDFAKLTNKQKASYCKLSNNTVLRVLPLVNERREIVMKKIPDYKNYCVKTIWRVEK